MSKMITTNQTLSFFSEIKKHIGACCFMVMLLLMSGTAWAQTCYNLNVGGGSYASETSWEILDSEGALIVEGSNEAEDLEICLADACYTLNLQDSWGDGWNGNNWTLSTLEGELIAGPFTITESEEDFSSSDFALGGAACATDCPNGNFGAACDDGDENTFNDIINDDCECVGSTPAIGSFCDDAIAIECNAEPITFSSTTSIATNTTTCSMGSNGLWFSFIGTGNDITVNTVADFDHVMSTNTGSCDDLVNVDCEDSELSGSTESYTIEGSVEGEMYYIYVAHWNSSNSTTGDITISVSCDDGIVDCEDLGLNIGDACDDEDDSTINDVVNEDCNCAGQLPAEGSVCESAIPVDCNAEPATYSSAVSNGTNTTTCSMGSNGLWFSFMGTGGDITINSSSTFDHEMSINSGACGALVNVGCKDGFTGAETYTILTSVEGLMYSVYIAHWSSSNSTTGDITVDIDCATPPACSPPSLALAVQDANGGAIEGCLDAGSEYFVLATLAGGEGNDSYNVSGNDSEAVEVDADGSVVLGPFVAGTDVDVTAVGAEDDDCDVSASIDSPALCAPANDACADAAAIACGDTLIGNTTGATASGLDTDCGNFGSSDARDLFYTFEADGTSDYNVSLSQPAGSFAFDGVLFVYSGPCDDLTSLGCSDSGSIEEVALLAPAAGTYTIRLFDYSGTAAFILSLECTPIITYDCPQLEANIGDVCYDEAQNEGVLDANCGCFVAPTFDCPQLEANIGDDCLNVNGVSGVIDEECNCFVAPTFDCPQLEANIGDDCQNADGDSGVIDEDCNCFVAPSFDCPQFEANIGDACDDGNPDTENDIIDANCGCAGTPVQQFDCPELEANIGDACNDGDPNTGNDVLIDDCTCAGIPIVTPTCDDFVYYISDHAAADGISDIYAVTLSGGVATMEYIATSDIEIHIAYNEVDNLIYAVSKHTNSYRTLNPHVVAPSFGPTIALGADYGELTAAVFNADGKLLIGSQNNNAIYSVNVVSNLVSPYDAYSPVTGGDLAFGSDGMLYLATRSGNGLYQNYPSPAGDVLIGSVTTKVTGLAITDSDQLLVSNQGNSSLEVRNLDGTNPGTTYVLTLDGEPYTLRDGDMASGCNSFNDTGEQECDNYKLYYIHSPQGSGQQPLLEVTLNGDGTASHSTVIANIGGHIGLSPDGSIIYNVNGSQLKVIDVDAASIIATINIVTSGGAGLSGFPAATVAADGTLYVGHSGTNQVYTLDPISGVATPYGPNRNVNGGDLIDVNGDIWLITRNNNRFTNVISGVSFTVPVTEINGAAVLGNGNVLLADGNGGSLLKEVELATQTVVATYDINLPLFNGDLAGACIAGGGLNTECYGLEILEFVQGLQTNGSPVPANRSDATAALGQPDASNAAGGFVSLGVGGYITIGFGGVIYDAPGNDIRIWETSFSGDACGASDDEQADIALSQDGVNFVSVGSICRDGEVDIAGTGLDYVSAIRITNSASTGSLDGYDVDGVEAINGCSDEPVVEEGDCYATEVVEYVQGTSFNGGAVAANRTDASKALGAPERVDQLVFVSLGYGGSITLAFDGAIPNGPGDDIEIVETTYGNSSCASYAEFADVYVSVDGINFIFAKTVCRADGFVDISDAGSFAYVNFVKVVNNNDLSNTPDAFDVDGVVALYNCEEEPVTPGLRPVTESELSSFPNPTAGQSQVVFVTAETGRTLVEVYDMSGRNIATLFNAEAQSSKEYTLDFDGAALPNGVYIYRMTTNNETIVEKFMIAK